MNIYTEEEDLKEEGQNNKKRRNVSAIWPHPHTCAAQILESWLP
jgi:hypothetical protein